jgi:hypothetical protein
MAIRARSKAYTTLQPCSLAYHAPYSPNYHLAAVQTPLQPCMRLWWSAWPVASRVASHIGKSSGEDDDDPNVATSDVRAPPQGSTAQRR